MFKKIWQMFSGKDKNGQPRLPGPRDIPDPVGRVLVTQFQQDPNWVWRQKVVVRPRTGKKTILDVRVIDSEGAAKKRVPIRDYTTLDEHPELILFEGWFDKRTNAAQIKRPEKRQPTAA